MGIKGLNRFLRDTCEKNIYQVSLWELQGKTIAIDTSIYLYKFNGDGSDLIDGFYHMISLFKYNRIIPLFVFDGNPPAEKFKILENRRNEKSKAESKYNLLKETNSYSNRKELLELKKKFNRVSHKDTRNIKKLMTLMGVSYYECKGESDPICVKLVETNIAYACMSEDMDMFVYGCNKVLRYFSLLNSTVVVYDLKGILETLHVTFKEFKEICIISGTDYNTHTENIMNLQQALVLFMKYKAEQQDNVGYIHWLYSNGYVDNINTIHTITHMFDISNIDNIPTKHSNNYNIIGTKEFLEKHGFIFM